MGGIDNRKLLRFIRAPFSELSKTLFEWAIVGLRPEQVEGARLAPQLTHISEANLDAFGNTFSLSSATQLIQEWLVVVDGEDCAIGMFRQLNSLGTIATTKVQDSQPSRPLRPIATICAVSQQGV